MYVYDIRATLSFLSGFYVIAHTPTHFCPGIIHYISQPARLKLAGLFREKNPARQVNQPVFNQSHIIEIIVGQTSIIAELYLKIDFPLNEPVSSQPISYNQALRFCLQNKTLARIEMTSCYAYGCIKCSSSSSEISFHRLRSKNKRSGTQKIPKGKTFRHFVAAFWWRLLRKRFEIIVCIYTFK